jgi:glycopeptide antibiotics resistance protein
MNKHKVIPFLLFVGYLILLVNILVLKLLPVVTIGPMMFNFGGTQEGPANLIPFKTIIPYLSGKNGYLIPMINIVGNIIALVPAGFLIPFVYNKMNWRKTTLLAILLGLSIETTQLILHIGIFDIDDVILNCFGVIIGFWKFNLYQGFSKNIQRIINAIALLIFGGLTILILLVFNKVVTLPFGLASNESIQKMMPPINNNASNPNCCDLCNGTPGTGQVIAIGENSFSIKRRDGVVQIIKLAKGTVIKNSKGVVGFNDLKLDDHVTLIIDETETASLILICGIAK